jgi:ABC-type Mn2+/Zn2+ transport system ATPase subunit
MGLWREIGAFGGLDRSADGGSPRRSTAVGLHGLEARPIGALSGGQLQRALFARVMLQDAPLVLLDEPYGAIDAASVRDLAALVRHWHDEGRTVIASCTISRTFARNTRRRCCWPANWWHAARPRASSAKPTCCAPGNSPKDAATSTQAAICHADRDVA